MYFLLGVNFSFDANVEATLLILKFSLFFYFEVELMKNNAFSAKVLMEIIFMNYSRTRL